MNKVAKILIVGVLFTGCFTPEDFPDAPTVDLVGVSFYDFENSLDSLIIEFDFTDGDGNFGILISDVFPPYHDYDVYLDANDMVVTTDNVDEAVPPIYTAPLLLENFKPTDVIDGIVYIAPTDQDYPVVAFDKLFFSDNVDDIPFECPGLANQGSENIFLDVSDSTNNDVIVYTLQGGEIIEGDPQTIDGEFPVIIPEFSSNLKLTLLEKVNDEFREIDFQDKFNTTLCIGNFDGRVPWFDQDGKSGVIRYSIQSRGFPTAFGDNEIRLKIQINDRSFNWSNEDSVQFFLEDITTKF